jgi:predicted transcriptional regulator
MKILTVTELILKYLKKKRKFCFGGTIEREMITISKPSTISRKLRAMAEDNLIIKDYKSLEGSKRRYVVYKMK